MVRAKIPPPAADTMRKCIQVFAYDGILKHLGHKAEVLGPQKLAQLDEMYMAARADAKVLEEELQERKEMLDRVFTEINELSQQSKVIQAGHKNAKQKLVEAERKEQRLAEQIAEKNQQVKDLIASADEDQADYVNMTQVRIRSLLHGCCYSDCA